jgi:hypothetical protein
MKTRKMKGSKTKQNKAKSLDFNGSLVSAEGGRVQKFLIIHELKG